MSAASLSGASLTAAHDAFVAELPRIDAILRYQFRTWPRRRRDEAIADARAAAWAAWAGLIRRGKDPRDVGPGGIAFNATRYVRGRRKFGCGATGRSAIDIYDDRARRRCGLKLISLETVARATVDDEPEAWRQWTAANNRVTPADEAAFRIDFQAWMESLPERKRRMAELLALGHETVVVAKQLGVTQSAVSQSRTWLARSWRQFQGGAEPAR
jgi:hypothetical protein